MAGKQTNNEIENKINLLIPDDIAMRVGFDKYRKLFENAPLGIFRATLEGRYIEVNNTMAKLLGYSSPEDVIKNVTDIATQIYTEAGLRKRIIREISEKSELINYETYFKRKDGTEFPVILSMNLVKEASRSNSFVVGIINDISEKKAIEDELLSERDNLRILIDNIPDYIYLKDKNGKFTIVNKAFANLVGVPRAEELEGLSDSDVFSDDMINNILCKDNEIIESGEPVFNEEIFGNDNRQNRNLYILISKIPIKNKKGVVKGLIGIGKDFTDLKIAEQMISASEANLNAVVESARNAIWSVDRNYKLTTINTYFKKFFKSYYHKDLNIGDHAINIFPKNEREKWKLIYDRALKGELWVQEENYTNDNINIYLENSINPIVDVFHNITGVTVFSSDITERKITEEAMKESEERFRQLAEYTNDVFILSNKNNILYANPAFKRVYGRNTEDVIINPEILEECIHPDDKDLFLNYRKAEFSKKRSRNGVQYRIIKPDGDIRIVWTRIFPVFNEKGKIYRYVYVTSDISEQNELELSVVKAKTLQKAILDNIPYLAWLKDSDGYYISVNEPFAQHYNLKPSDIIGKTDFDICPKELATKYQAIDKQVKKSGKRQLIEDIDETSNGKRWSETFKTPIFSPNGKIIGITAISRDITERKKMEDAIIENEKHFRSLLQNSSDAITILNEDGAIVFDSSRKSRISEFDIEELAGKPLLDIVHPDDKATMQETLEKVLAQPNTQIKKEYRSLHKNKKWIYVESIFSNQLENPSIQGIVVNSRDVSDRKMAELKERVYHDNLIFLSNSALDLLGISEREELYKYIAEKLYHFLENAVVIVAAFNDEESQFNIKHVSGLENDVKKIHEILGHNPVGMSFPQNKFLSNFDNAGNVIILKDELEKQTLGELNKDKIERLKEVIKVHKIYNISLARHNKLLGNITILTLNKSIIKFKHIIETFVHQVSVALHRSQLEYELKKSKEKAEESDQLKTAFLANMSHEIRTPMNGILGFAEMLNDDSLTPGNKRKYLDIINSNGKMLVSLIDDIIDFAKIEAGQIKIVKQDFSLNALLSQVHSSFLSESLKKDKSNVKLRIRKAFPNESCFIKSDPNRLRQILTNLIGNAFKFTSEGFIEFGYDLNKNNILEFYVTDTGIGIPEEKLHLIFERFMQADSSRTRKYGGSGLGLAISKGFVELLGGNMWVESVLDVGSSFYFSIPYVPVKQTSDSVFEDKKPKSKYIWEGKSILVAEDDKFSYKFLEGFLKQTKANVIHAEDGKQAVDICRDNKNIDIVLMDIQMPELNGLEATTIIKEFSKDLPIIAQTANAIPEERLKCFEAGCNDFITKPVNINELYRKIDKFFSRK